MKAVVVTAPGGPEVLQVQEVEDPQIKSDEVLIKVEATALNRADTFQRKGLYPPPPGSSQYLGLECSGTIEAVGEHVSRWKVGDQVCALLSGGGYAEKVAVPAGQVLPVPPGISLKDAASFPEVACTVWSTIFMMSRLSSGETLLVHGGSSGIGTFAIQIAKYRGVRVFVTAGSEEKLAACKELGADVGINYKTEDFVARVKEETSGKGVDVILDSIGQAYFKRNLDSLAFDGRLFVIGTLSGSVTELDLRVVLSKRLTIQVSTLCFLQHSRGSDFMASANNITLASIHPTESKLAEEKNHAPEPSESKVQSKYGIEDLFIDSPSVTQTVSVKPQTDVKIDIINLFEKSSMVSPFSMHHQQQQQQQAMLSQQQSLVMATAANSSGSHAFPSLQPASQAIHLPTQNGRSIGQQVPGNMTPPNIQYHSQIENGYHARPIGNAVSYLPSSMYKMRPVAPINGVRSIGASGVSTAPQKPSVTPTPSGRDFDFSSLTQGLFTKR